MKKGFTIVEMLVVIAVLAILMGLVGTAATSAIRNARGKRCDAMKRAWQGAISAYYAQKGEWPGDLENLAKNSTETIVDLSDAQVNSVFQAVAQEAVQKNNALIDVTALYVCRNANVTGCNDLHGGDMRHSHDQLPDNLAYSGCNKTHYCGDRRCTAGMDFTEAQKHNLSPNSLAYGYPGKRYGKFRRFYIRFNTQTDTATVGTRFTECKHYDTDANN